MPNQPKKIDADIEQLEIGQFKLTGILDFETVPVVLQKSLKLFSNCDSLSIDFSSISRSNSAGLALLIEWMRIARTDKKQIAFHHVPVQMLEIAKLCGIDNDLSVQ